MIFLIILGVILLIIAAVLFLPVGVEIDFKEDFVVKIFFCKIKVYESGKEKKKPKEKTISAKTKEKPKGLFSRVKEKRGFSGAIKEFFGLFKDVLSHTKGFLRHIKFKRVKLSINVASEDAAVTAIEYGAVCAAVYPFLANLSSVYKIEYKKIDIRSDFESKNSDFSFSVYIALRIFVCLITLFKVYKDYKKFTARIEADERK